MIKTNLPITREELIVGDDTFCDMVLEQSKC